MECVAYYVLDSPDVLALLQDNQTSISELLRQELIEVEESRGSNPIHAGGFADKEPVSIILASAGLVMALTPAISRVLSKLANRPVIVTEKILSPVEDSSGRVVLDGAGQPLTYWADHHSLLQPTESGPTTSNVELKGPLGLSLTFGET